ncbi:hypothetical protein ATI02_4967 [Pseudomonas baetica]|uniref:Secreted protein n=1 Tax=Pseudomonas baetica TaxID=674054 RepID=A0ABX4Q583_9PSED|nr:hypothetical protein [Pseudomonas baetica]PKA71949.1 hypothetical protein ATI02_4967 [Pseudomonas baetica]PTC20411.1 hypothetical protein C0J26_10715 [Pseudomonas baetica]
MSKSAAGFLILGLLSGVMHLSLFEETEISLPLIGCGCSGLMKPDTHLGENARQIEVSDDQTTSFFFR